MSHTKTATEPVWPYVLVSALVKIVAGGILVWYASRTGDEFLSSSTPVSILAIGAGVGWYSYRVNRPMQRVELLRFASGFALVDVILSLLVLIGPILWVGESLSMRHVDLILGGDGTTLSSQDLPLLGALAIFTTIVEFGLGYFFAWIMTKKLPRGGDRPS